MEPRHTTFPGTTCVSVIAQLNCALLRLILNINEATQMEHRQEMPKCDSSGAFRLSEYRGKSAVVAYLDLPDAEARRLKRLGIFEGQLIEFRRAGAVLILKAIGGRVAIAQEVAQQIVVQSAEIQAI